MTEAQLSFLDPPIARRLDPPSSQRAAAAITAGGLRQSQRAAVIAAVARYPGRTSLELAALMKADRHMVARRLPDAEATGSVRRGSECECTGSRRPAVTWWPV